MSLKGCGGLMSKGSLGKTGSREKEMGLPVHSGAAQIYGALQLSRQVTNLLRVWKSELGNKATRTTLC